MVFTWQLYFHYIIPTILTNLRYWNINVSHNWLLYHSNKFKWYGHDHLFVFGFGGTIRRLVKNAFQLGFQDTLCQFTTPTHSNWQLVDWIDETGWFSFVRIMLLRATRRCDEGVFVKKHATHLVRFWLHMLMERMQTDDGDKWQMICSKQAAVDLRCWSDSDKVKVVRLGNSRIKNILNFHSIW